MTETIFEKLAAAVATLKLDFSSEEFALYAEEHELSELEMAAVENGTEKNTWTLTVPCCIIEIGQNSHSNRCWA